MNNNQRLESLDALRGFDMLFIMGFSALVAAVCSLFPNGEECWLATQMDHVAWDGIRHHDTIFPLFLFIAGISFPFSWAKQRSNGLGKGRSYAKIFRRAAILVVLGLVYNGFFKMELSTLRFPSVLARIGLAWMFAAILFINFKPGTMAVIAAVILVGYSFLCMIPAPDAPAGADSLSRDGCLVGYIDRCIIPNHMYKNDGGGFDPEGILSLLPAIVNAMLGMFTGEFVRKENISGNRKTVLMFAAAAVLLVSGLLWNLWTPINKKLWSASFVLVVGAYSLAMFALFFWIIDVKGYRKWAFPFKVIGLNSITIYMAQKIINFKFTSDFFLKGFASLCPEGWASVILLAGYVLVSWLFLYFLYKKNIFLKV